MKFVNDKLEEEVLNALRYIKMNEKGSGLNLEFFNLLDENFRQEDYDDIVDNDYELRICPDNSYEDIELTLRELLDLINELERTKLIDDIYCISDRKTLIRVDCKDYNELRRIDALMDSRCDILDVKFSYKNVEVECSITKGFTLFGLILHFTNNFDEYNPSINSDDLFIQIKYSSKLSKEDIDLISESYMFELFASADVKLYKASVIDRSLFDFDDIDQISDKIILRPLIVEPGMNELLRLFNEAENGYIHNDFSILQYTKVIEYVSQTVVRQDITNLTLKKLFTRRGLNPDATFVKEIESMLIELKNKYDSDRNSIKETIKVFCDVYEIADYAPKYLDKLINLKSNLSKPKVEKDRIIDAAFDSISESITDTRNCIAHAKSNYIMKGSECPEAYKDDFIIMLRIISYQVIRWFARVNESSRVMD